MKDSHSVDLSFISAILANPAETVSLL